MNIIDKYNAVLDSKRSELAAFTSNGVGRISLPSPTPVVQSGSTPSANGKAATALMVGGAAILIGGIASSKTEIGRRGGVVLAGGIAKKVAGGKSIHTGSLGKMSDDKVIKRHGKCHQKTGEHSRKYIGENYFEKSVYGSGTKVKGRFKGTWI